MAVVETITTDLIKHRSLPGLLSTAIEERIDDYLGNLGDTDTYKVKHYAGEFLAEDNLKRLKADVTQFPHVLYDVELIEEIDSDSRQTMPTDTFAYIIFCCHSNFFDESIQWKSSYELAWDVRAAFQGLKLELTADVHSEGLFVPKTIERELHIPGMSVHTFRLEIEITHDSKGTI